MGAWGNDPKNMRDLTRTCITKNSLLALYNRYLWLSPVSVTVWTISVKGNFGMLCIELQDKSPTVRISQTRPRSGTLLLVQGASSGLTQRWFILAAVVELRPFDSYFSPLKFNTSTAVYASGSNYWFANFFLHCNFKVCIGVLFRASGQGTYSSSVTNFFSSAARSSRACFAYLLTNPLAPKVSNSSPGASVRWLLSKLLVSIQSSVQCRLVEGAVLPKYVRS